jgi:arylsulfatase A-like enzyme
MKSESQLDRMISAIIFASVLGLIIGVLESTTSLLFGVVAELGCLPVSARFAPYVVFFYVAFVASLYALLFTIPVVISSLALIFTAKDADPSRRDAAPYWGLFFPVLVVAMFGVSGEILMEEERLASMLAIMLVQIAFVALCLWQVRAFFAKLRAKAQAREQKNNPDGGDFSRAEHEARVGAYIFLFFLAVIITRLSKSSVPPLALSMLPLGALLFAPPLSALVHAGLRLLHGALSGGRIAGKLRFPAAISVVAIPLVIVALLWNRYPDEAVFIPSPDAARAEAKPGRPNVIILLIDMLRADHVGCYGYELATTPNIDRFAGEGVLFSNAVAESPWTLPSTATLLSGLHPAVHGATTTGSSVPDEIPMMAEIFRDNGYATGAFISNPVLERYSNMQQGFDDYVEDFSSRTYLNAARAGTAMFTQVATSLQLTKLLLSRKGYDARSVPDEAKKDLFKGAEMMESGRLNGWALKWVSEREDSPFFLYMHYFDVHGPYNPPHPFKEDLSGDVVEETINLYDGGLRHIDENIDQFIQQLERRGLRDNSIIIITSDHGHGFMEHGVMDHGQHLFKEQIRIPLLFLNTPAFPFNAVIEEPVGLADVLPTLVDLLDLRRPENILDGSSFAGSLASGKWLDAPDYRYAETGFSLRFDGAMLNSVTYKNRWKYIAPIGGKLRGSLYDLERDPGELTNVAKQEPALTEDLRLRLNKQFSDFSDRAFPPRKVAPDENTRKAIEALGYL